MMQTTRSKRILFAAITAAAVLWIAAYFTLYSLGDLLGSMGSILGEDTAAMLSTIFTALKTSQIRPSSISLFVIGAGYLLLSLLCRQKPLPAILLPIFILAGYGCAVWFASVNGVRFGDVILSLANMVKNGLFDII